MKLTTPLSSKEAVLGLLRQEGDYISGTTMSSELGLSRVAVWKCVEALREEGYGVESGKRGYKLAAEIDPFDAQALSAYEGRARFVREAGSTMDLALELSRAGAAEGAFVVAESQAEGRGRQGRNWSSGKGGLYLSYLLAPRSSPSRYGRIVLGAAAAVAEAARELTGAEARVKWPNDVLSGGRKFAGLLAEFSVRGGTYRDFVLGAGINVNNPVGKVGATSLSAMAGRDITRAEALEAVDAALFHRPLEERFEELMAGEILIHDHASAGAGMKAALRDDGSLNILGPGKTIEIIPYGERPGAAARSG